MNFILGISGRFGPFMAGGALEYDYDPNPTLCPSWSPLSVCFYRLGELAMLTKSVIPGFSLKLSHFGVSSHSQYIFKTTALTQLTGENGATAYAPSNVLSGSLTEVAFSRLDGDIFDLA